MTDNKRRQYIAEFKKEAVELVSNQGYTVAEAAGNRGIRGSMLGRWRREQLKGLNGCLSRYRASLGRSRGIETSPGGEPEIETGKGDTKKTS